MNIRSALAITMMLAAVPAWADEMAELRTGCREAISIWDKREEKKFLAMQTTSASEALRAGYCRGVVIEYLRTARPCYPRQNAVETWREVAQRIASGQADQAGNIDQLLKLARCGY